MAGKLPLRRKIEIAFAGYLVARQKADPTFLPGHAIVCGTTGRSPDDPEEGQGAPTEPPLPYTSVGCSKMKDRADFPPGYGIKEGEVVVYSKTQASDESRACADDREESVAELFEDGDAIVAALNQPADAGTPDTRRVKGLYLTAIEDVETADDHSASIWEDQVIAKVVCQGFDPAYA